MSVSQAFLGQIARKQYRAIAAAGTLVTNRVHIYTGAAGNIALPASANLGDTITIVSAGSGVFTVTQAAGQQVRHLTTDTTAGVTGTIAAGTVRDVLVLVCTTAGTSTIWTTMPSKGTFSLN